MAPLKQWSRASVIGLSLGLGLLLFPLNSQLPWPPVFRSYGVLLELQLIILIVYSLSLLRPTDRQRKPGSKP